MDGALDGLESDLGGCGVTVLRGSTPEQLAGAVRAAFDPRSGFYPLGGCGSDGVPARPAGALRQQHEFGSCADLLTLPGVLDVGE